MLLLSEAPTLSPPRDSPVVSGDSGWEVLLASGGWGPEVPSAPTVPRPAPQENDLPIIHSGDPASVPSEGRGLGGPKIERM